MGAAAASAGVDPQNASDPKGLGQQYEADPKLSQLSQLSQLKQLDPNSLPDKNTNTESS